MTKHITIDGVECIAKRENIYCKRGPYKHANIKGWNAYNAETGELVLSSQPAHTRSAYAYEEPEFKTFADMQAYAEDCWHE